MKKIQEVLLNNFIEVGSVREMYYKSEKLIFTSADGSAKLVENGYYDFFTYYNVLESEKWRIYTHADNFFLVMKAKGKFNVELYGYMGEYDHLQREGLGRFSFDISKKEEIIIPFPKLMKSCMVSFAISAEEDTFIYSAYYASKIEDNLIKNPYITIFTEVDSKDNRVYESIAILNENASDYADKYTWIINDPKSILKKSNYSGVEIYKSGGHKNIDNSTNAFFCNQKCLISAESFKRLFDFLSILKEDYKDYSVLGDVFEETRPNIKLDISLYSGEKSNKSSAASTEYELLNSNYGDTYVFLKSRLNKESVSINLFNSWKKNQTEDYFKSDSISINGICVYAKKVKSYVSTFTKIHKDASELVKLYDLILTKDIEVEVTRHMYYRSDRLIEVLQDDVSLLHANTYYDFFTYFNSVSLEKWKKYTYVNNIYLVVEADGEFDLELFGHFKNKTGYQKEWLGKKSYRTDLRETIVIQFPNGIQSSLISFGIFAKTDVKIFGAYYASDINKSKLKKPLIAMNTTTFKKESYVRKNIELLTENLFNDDEYRDNFTWNIIDNGKTLDTGWVIDGKIQIIGNKNVGGAGGFAKGMMVSLKQKPLPTHILLMDDDVLFMPDSFKRLCNLLRIVKDEHKNRFVSGAMLKMGQPNIQHEDTGKLNEQGYHEAVKPNYDLNLWDHIIDNEILHEDIPNQYAAWWFCCIPVGIARLDNLPLPVFVRGDDVEYSLRNKAEFITLNGICIWHEGFEGKFSASLEYYQVNRNELAVRATHPELSNVDCIGHIKMIFWEEMYKFNYKGAALLLDAIEDYMKGPDFYKTLDGEKSMKKKKKRDNQPKPLTPEIRAMIDFERLYDNPPIESKLRMIYDYTYNGQARIPELFLRKKTGIIPYGWGYFPANMVFADTIIAVDSTNETYVIYKKSRDKFNRLKARFERIMNKYNAEHKQIEKAYQDSFGEITGEKFWDSYLG